MTLSREQVNELFFRSILIFGLPVRTGQSADSVIDLFATKTNKYEISLVIQEGVNLKQKCANLSKHNVPTKTAQ
ncbi:hypothetical protein W01_19440 [Candidatus Nitrotoga sp. AM1P]|nr:hypothetical protein W01_19440 [Candidatus Nitrotoga sp. AM1P]